MKEENLAFQPPGTLAPPGPIGRGVRIVMGLLCTYALVELLQHRAAIAAAPASSLDNLALMLLAPLVAFNSVINIGFSRSWNRWPLRVSIAGLLLAAGIARWVSGSFDHPVFGIPLWVFLTYFYAHLGLSFLLAGLRSTPGCEMRAIPDLWSVVSGRPAQEHHCPAFLDRVDRWERRRQQAGR